MVNKRSAQCACATWPHCECAVQFAAMQGRPSARRRILSDSEPEVEDDLPETPLPVSPGVPIIIVSDSDSESDDFQSPHTAVLFPSPPSRVGSHQSFGIFSPSTSPIASSISLGVDDTDEPDDDDFDVSPPTPTAPMPAVPAPAAVLPPPPPPPPPPTPVVDPPLPAGVTSGDDASRMRRWLVTWNFPMSVYVPAGVLHVDRCKEWVTRMLEIVVPLTVGYVYQFERAPTSGQLHLHLYCHFKKLQRFHPLKALLTIGGIEPHLDCCNGTHEDLIRYCTKVETREVNLPGGSSSAEFLSVNFGGGQGRRSDLDVVAEEIKAGSSLRTVAMQHSTSFMRYTRGIQAFHALVNDRPRSSDRPIFAAWVEGDANIGKTLGARGFLRLILKEDWYVWSPKGNSSWWDGYTGQSCILVDDLVPNTLPYSELLRICDPNAGEVQIGVHGGFVQCRAHTIIITTNFTIDQCFDKVPPTTLAALKRRFVSPSIAEVNSFRMHSGCNGSVVPPSLYCACSFRRPIRIANWLACQLQAAVVRWQQLPGRPSVPPNPYSLTVLEMKKSVFFSMTQVTCSTSSASLSIPPVVVLSDDE